MRRWRLGRRLESLYAKIFLWFCATIVGTLAITLAVTTLTGTQPFGRRWMGITQDLYARTAVDFYESGGRASLEKYLRTLGANSGIHGQLLNADGNDVLGEQRLSGAGGVLAETRRSGLSSLRLGRSWTAATPVVSGGTRYVFVMEVHPMRGFVDGTFAVSLLPRLLLGMVLVAGCCLLLARHVTQPIRVLEQAATELAAGRLEVRASPKIAPRRDELAGMALAFDRMAERIEGLIRTQREMLGHISHELRSPLTRLGVSLELLRRGEEESLERMQAEIDRMDQMIGEILEVTRLDLQRQTQAARGRVDLAELLAEVAEDASFEARETGHSIECEGIEACVVTGDAAMLRSCCENIVRNALLHTPAGTVVRMGIEREAGDAVVWMEDDGPGVAEEALGHLCELFYRAGAAAETHPDGTGFGLAIAQRIVAMHGGVLSARNLVPHGLGIRISLPVAGDLS